MPWAVFAVVDGGHFDDLPAVLSGAGLAARSLFLGQGGREAELAGPWLVPIAGEGDAALYEHLRRLNMARLPAWAAAGKDGPEPGVAEGQFSRILAPAGEVVFFAID